MFVIVITWPGRKRTQPTNTRNPRACGVEVDVGTTRDKRGVLTAILVTYVFISSSERRAGAGNPLSVASFNHTFLKRFAAAFVGDVSMMDASVTSFTASMVLFCPTLMPSE